MYTLSGTDILITREFTKDVDGIEVSEFTDNFWQQARTRDETVNTFNCKCSGKDGKAFWFLAGYRAGKSDMKEFGDIKDE